MALREIKDAKDALKIKKKWRNEQGFNRFQIY